MIEHEADLPDHPEWRERPRIGDLVHPHGCPDLVGEVMSTFYRCGEDGMHVKYAHGGSWTSCRTCIIVERRTPVPSVAETSQS